MKERRQSDPLSRVSLPPSTSSLYAVTERLHPSPYRSRFSTASVVAVLSAFTSSYYFVEIAQHHRLFYRTLLAILVQWAHDGVCVLFILLFCQSIYQILHRDNSIDTRAIVQLNALYTVIMFFFSIYKRCILTLWYNAILGLPVCTRYIPIWKRFMVYPVYVTCHYASNTTDTAPVTDIVATMSWLNDHILQSGLMVVVNTCYAILLLSFR